MNLKSSTCAFVLSLLFLAGPTFGQTITVDTSNDVVDFSGTQQVANLPGPDGKVSLPEAGLASDNTLGVQTIAFHIPPQEWLYQNFFPGRAVLRPFLGFRVFDTAIIDGTTQTAFTGETNPEGGAEVVIWQESYLNDNVGGAMIGFDNSSIHLSGGSDNVIQANTKTGIELYNSSSNVIGGTNPGEGNTGGFIQIDRSSYNVVVGNTMQRMRVLGWVGGGQPATDNVIGGPTLGERNYITGLGTWNSEGWPSGFAVQIFDAIGTVVENNWIGTTPDGLQQGHLATTAGIYLEGENYDTTIRGNRIAGILGHRIGTYPGVLGTAINIYGAGGGVLIVGNKIGLNANDEPVLGSVTGIATTNYYLGPVQDVVIGGSAASEGNEIAGHLDAGISVANTFSGVFISANSIHDNAGIGIDLVTPEFQYGVTPNDPLDADTGGNGLQNFPVLLSAGTTGSAVTIHGSLDSSSSTTFAVQFFASLSCDPSGFGEGQTYLGTASVFTNAAGHADFDALLGGSVPNGRAITSTATRVSNGDTSEFSACVAVTSGAPPVAKALATPTGGSTPLTVQFSSAGSSDPDGTIVSYSWSFGDGGNSTAANPSHTYTSAGTYTATLTVTDNDGGRGNATVTIIANPASNTVLRSAAINLSATLQGTKVSVTGNVVVKNASGATVSGAVVSATWTRPGGTLSTQTATTSSKGTAKFTTSGGRGTYTLTVTNITKTGYTFDRANSVLSRSITQ